MSRYAQDIRFYLNHPDAVMPTKANHEAVGFDLTAVDFKKLGNGLIIADTHVMAAPPHGYWLQLVARSSLFKYNLMPVNGFGVIDPDYRGHLKFVMRKLDRKKPYPDFPLRFGQLIPIRSAYVGGIQEKTPLKTTQRGEGGFGSTG